MKPALVFLSLGLMAAPAWAGHFSDNPDLEQSILNVHEAEFPPRMYSGMAGGVGGVPGDARTDTTPRDYRDYRTDEVPEGTVAPGVRESEPVLGDPDSGTR